MAPRLLDYRSALAICAVLGLCFLGLTGHVLLQLRQQTWDSAIRESDNLVAALAQDIGRNIELYDLSLQAVVDGLQLPGIERLNPQMRQALLFDRAATAKYLGSILVLDESGVVVDDAGSIPPRPAVLADRDYFQIHRDQPDQGLFISAPFRQASDGDDLVIAFSRRISRPDGSFAGVVASTLRLEYLRSLFQRFSLGDRGAITLLRQDGTMLMRTPYSEASIGRSLAGSVAFRQIQAGQNGHFTAKAVIDGVTRVVNFTHVEALPLAVTVSKPERDILAGWNSRAAVIAVLLATICLVTTALAKLFHEALQQRFRAEAEMRRSEAQLRLLADHATDVIIRLDAAMIRQYVSPSSGIVLGYPPDEMVGHDFRETLHPDDLDKTLSLVEEARRLQAYTSIDYRIRHKDGDYVWVEGRYNYVPSDGGFTVVLRDISERKAAEHQLSLAYDELQRIAATDGLTGLANRRRFDEAMVQEWRRAAREEQPLTLLMLDVDYFKQLNDRYGHLEGDACLKAVAQAVSGCVRRPADLVARYGGEEIAVLLPNTDESNAAIMAERIRQTICDLRLRNAGNTAHGGILTASLGSATVIPGQCTTTQMAEMTAFISACDQALYAAKKNGRNRVMAHRPVRLSIRLPSGLLRLS
jgi:diguanylate cyclase (GGDEF)-like protein/PAS domain S-box-containing protein